MADSRNYLFVAALNLCPEYSGYLFSANNDPMNLENSLKILTSTWQLVSRQNLSSETPTCLLLNGKRELVAFGYDAELQWAELVLDEEQDDYYYFDKSKICLYNNKNIRSGMEIVDITEKKQLPAFIVFKSLIQYLVNHLFDLLKRRGTAVHHDEVRWVLIIPENFTDGAKSLIRSSAEAAGIPTHSLIFALEPETISIFCSTFMTRTVMSEHMFNKEMKISQYMVVDLEGNTADIRVYQRAAKNIFKEKHRAVGNDCGGISIDKRFLEQLEKIFGKTILNSLKKECPLAYIDLIQELKLMRETVDTTTKTNVVMSIPFVAIDKLCLKVHGKNLETLLENWWYSKEIQLNYDKIRISVEFLKKLFVPSIDSVISLMKDLFRKVSSKHISHVLLIGGFSKNQFLQSTIKSAFPDKRVIIPEEDGLPILKGAVLIGERQDYIQYRGMRYSYGVKTNVPWNEKKYDRKHYVVMEGEERCDNIFSIIFEKDESVKAGMIVTKSFYTTYKHQDKMNIMVYVSEKTPPEYVHDDRCFLIFTSIITFPETSEEKRWVDVEFVLGNTVINLKAHDRKSGKVISSHFNLIE